MAKGREPLLQAGSLASTSSLLPMTSNHDESSVGAVSGFGHTEHRPISHGMNIPGLKKHSSSLHSWTRVDYRGIREVIKLDKLTMMWRCNLPSRDLHARFYHGFCKHYLWPLHYLLPLSPSSLNGLRFDLSLWRSYLSANKLFADCLTKVLNLDDDFVWIQDYHLLALPNFLRKRFPRVKLRFFSPFPLSFLRDLPHHRRHCWLPPLPLLPLHRHTPHRRL